MILNEYDRNNMNGASISYEPPHCAVCGRTSPLNLHHVVFRSHGGKEGPTIMLCGNGNSSGCHGLAHSGRLFFRWVKAPFWDTWNEGTRGALGMPAIGGGHWECLVLDEPTKIETAWSMDGWRRL